LLVSKFGMAAISTGAVLREEAKRNTSAGFRLRRTMNAGELVDDATVCDAVASRIRLAGSSARPGDGLILDGFPRTVGQAKALDSLLESLGMPAPLVVHLDVPNDVLLRRLARRRQCAKCGAIYNGGSRCRMDGGLLVDRDDDNEGAVARRLAEYEAETLPVVDYYRGRDYRRIDGNRSAAEIAKDVCDILLFFAATAVAA
jgi:adenylate kinase